MADAPRPFLIPVRRRWTLWILPVIASLYFLAVVIIAALNNTINRGGVNYRILPRDVSVETLALVGVGLFALVILVELPFLIRRRPKREPAPEPAAAPADEEPAPWAAPAQGAIPAAPPPRDDELVMTSETQQGYRVIEYSRPAKSRHRNAVFTKAYVPVTKEYVLRVETLVAEGRDL